MTRVLYIEGSPNKDYSASIDVCNAFLDAYRLAHPDHEIQKLDIWNLAIPEFDEAALAAKYAGLSGNALTPAQAAAWQRIEQLAAPFHEADKLLFGVPLWNFSIPYKLKHLIDAISQKDVLFTFDGAGFAGKLAGKKAAVVYARGLGYQSPGSFTPAAEFDLQRPYMETWLKFVGVTDVTGIVVERTLFGPDGAVDRSRAIDEARMIARTF
ncbi:FMN-dependent NADH-azoreductase [Burkholderia contaminans FFH2055]|uniref:FMN-dependent NADH-azoreductase n=1 Tax=Burkholderia contaminans TaxID=488447 RepID=UPI0006265600|nr:NAD(P)H-dependent oxidoreductase [Burkholderia contaminans]KKL35897.1 FMN-dependent NADH-azoreductase [Burkholderia contaminans FFH2055]MEB4636527.1 NAD(P)H-dependent oxidoreductase [Burkholderia contaminans]MEB4651933.1 NAD(P)H-dependent oxidoreductase [Burkholderia contaminans]MEB4661502.1 NAD(P)H-dependent oxidoreductase [Burkholderia contaminans]MEB4666886.1 NAD(P)H-dependent oxidoreductase [Burkholderia contaminans]